MPATNESRIQCDVLVVGGGIAACFAAIKAAERGADVVIADKGFVGRSGQSPYADGFMIFNPAWGHDLEKTMERLNRHSEYLNNRYWTQKCLEDSYARYQDLISWGCSFQKDENGQLLTREEGEGLQVAAQFDKKAGAYGEKLRAQVRKSGAGIMDHLMIVELMKKDGRVSGAVGIRKDGDAPVVILAKATILCVGACGYKPNGYPALMQVTGDGEAMAYRAGADILGKEFVDAHFSKDGMPDPVAQRTAGEPPAPPPLGMGKLRAGPGQREDAEGTIISDKPDTVSGYMFSYLQSEFAVHEGRGPIYCRGGKSFGGATLGMSLRKADGLWPADHECRSTIPGLFAAGDALGTMQNGAAYSLGGGSIEGCSVSGTIAAVAAAQEVSIMPDADVPEEEIARAEEYVLAPLKRKSGFSAAWTIQLLRNYMTPYFVYFIKKADRLEATLTLVEFIRDHIVPNIYAEDIHDLRLAHEAKSLVLSAEMRLRSALFRTESRGNHYREDFPCRDDENWFCWTKIRNKDGKMTLEKAPIPEEWKPEEGLSYREKYPFVFPGEGE